jgi:hypothetical protein
MPDSVFMGLPGGNPSGSSTAVPGVSGTAPVPSVGTSTGTNPLTPAMPTGSAAPTMTSAGSFPAYSGGGDPNQLLTALSGMNPGGALGGAGSDWTHQLIGAFHKAGYPSAIASLMANFLSQGAGFNPQVVQSLLASLQPGIAQGQANIMEEFGAEGLSSSSPAAVGLAGFDAQATLNEGQIISQMYEQSVQNYMQVMLSGKESSSQQGGIGALLGGVGSLASGASGLFDSIDATTAAGGSSAAAALPAAVAGMM